MWNTYCKRAFVRICVDVYYIGPVQASVHPTLTRHEVVGSITNATNGYWKVVVDGISLMLGKLRGWVNDNLKWAGRAP